jgi:hypothetical protein
MARVKPGNVALAITALASVSHLCLVLLQSAAVVQLTEQPSELRKSLMRRFTRIGPPRRSPFTSRAGLNAHNLGSLGSRLAPSN